MSATHLRLYDPAGALIGILPDHEGLGVQEEHNGPGAFACNYSLAGVNAALINRDVSVISVVEGGVERPEFYLLEDDGDEPTDEGGAARMVQIGGRGLMALLELAVVFPKDYDPNGPTTAGGSGTLINKEPLHAFANATPGTILKTFIDRAKERSLADGAAGAGDAIRKVTYDFTETLDSAGQPWPTVYSISYEAGLDLLKVLLASCDNGLCDARMAGLTLRLFVPDTLYGLDRPDVILRAGREVTGGPRKRSRRTIRSHILGVGDEGAIVLRSNASARARYGRREGYEARGGVTNLDTLTRITDVQLTGVADASEGFTVECDLSAEGPKPTGATRTNLTGNPSVDPDLAGWFTFNNTAARTTTRSFPGSSSGASIMLTTQGGGGSSAWAGAGASAYYNVRGGDPITATYRVSGGAVAGRSANVVINEYSGPNATGTLLKATGGGGIPIPADGSWIAPTQTLNLRSDTQSIIAYVAYYNATAAGEVWYADAAQVMIGGPAAFFEGTVTNAAGYSVGQRIRYDQRRLSETEYEPLRVRTIATSWDKAGNRAASVELNDLFVEASVRLARKVDGIVNGSSSNSRAPQNPQQANDGIAPKAPASVSIATGTVQDKGGALRAVGTVSWPAVTRNSDESLYADAGNYFVSWGYVTPSTAVTGGTYDVPASAWTADMVARTELAYLDNLVPSKWIRARVRTIDQEGNSSLYVVSPPVQVATDLTGPNQPSKPVLTPTLGGVIATWDGKDKDGADLKVANPDFYSLQVHVSQTSQFTPSAATLVDTITGAGKVNVGGLPYDQVSYVRFLAYDTSGNPSATPSVQEQGQPNRVLPADLTDKIITAAKLADAVTTSIEQAAADAVAAQDTAASALSTANGATLLATNAAIAGQDGLSNNPTFDLWTNPAAVPDGYGTWNALPLREAAIFRTGPYAARWNLAANTEGGMVFSTAGVFNKMGVEVDYVTFVIEFQLVSGALDGAGVLIDWFDNVGAFVAREQVALNAVFPTPTLGRWYRLQKTVKRQGGGTFVHGSIGGYIMAGYTGLQPTAAKNIIIERFDMRPSTADEKIAYDQPAASAAAQTQANTALSTANGKGKSYYQGTPPVAGSTSDLWFDTANGNRPAKWDGTSWVPFGLGDQAIANLDAGKVTTGFLDALRIQARSINTEKLTIATYGPSLASNSGFEDPTALAPPYVASGWYRGGSTGTISRVAAAAESGSFGLRITAADGPAISDAFPVNPGDRLSLVARLRGQAGGTQVFLRVSFQNAAGAELGISDAIGGASIPTSFGDWGGLLPAVAPAGTVRGQIHLYNLSGTCDFDNVDVRKALVSAQIGDGAISAPKILAGAVTTEKLTVASVGGELFLNVNMEDGPAIDQPGVPEGWYTSVGTAVFVVRAGNTVGKSLAADVPAGEGFFFSSKRPTPVKVGDVIAWSIDCYSSVATNNGLFVRFTTYADSAGTVDGGQEYTTAYENSPFPAGWSTASGTLTVTKAGYLSIRPHGWVVSPAQARQVRFDNISARRVIVSAQIGEGQITTPKIVAGAITAQSAILADAVVLTAKIADAQIVNAKIQDATIQSAKIGNLTADKITAGSLQVNMTLTAGKILAIGANGRVEMNASGLAGVRTLNGVDQALTFFFQSATGDALMTGTIATATSGDRVEIGKGIAGFFIDGQQAVSEVRWMRTNIAGGTNPSGRAARIYHAPPAAGQEYEYVIQTERWSGNVNVSEANSRRSELRMRNDYLRLGWAASEAAGTQDYIQCQANYVQIASPGTVELLSPVGSILLSGKVSGSGTGGSVNIGNNLALYGSNPGSVSKLGISADANVVRLHGNFAGVTTTGLAFSSALLGAVTYDSLTARSDQRLKDSVKDAGLGGLAATRSFRAKQWKRRDHKSRRTEYGFVAQDLPAAVQRDLITGVLEDEVAPDLKGIDVMGVIALHHEAINEQADLNDDQARQIETLTERLRVLEAAK